MSISTFYLQDSLYLFLSMLLFFPFSPPSLLAALPYKTNLLFKPPHVLLNTAHPCTLTCKVPSSKPVLLSPDVLIHITWDIPTSLFPSLPGLFSTVTWRMLFFLFHSKFVQVSHITLSLGPSPPFTCCLTDLIQAANCLCGCLVTSSQPKNRRRQVYPEDFCADSAICSIGLEQSSSLFPHLQSIPAFPVTMDIGIRSSTCMLLALDMPLDSQVSYFNAYFCVRFPLPHHTNPSWHLFHY